VYAELHCLSNFSFLRGASRPDELVERAAKLGYAALALTDECSVAGVVRAYVAAREHGIKLMQDLLRRMVERDGSDLFITAGFPPALQGDGATRPVAARTLARDRGWEGRPPRRRDPGCRQRPAHQPSRRRTLPDVQYLQVAGGGACAVTGRSW